MLESALGWIGQIAGWIEQWIPHWFICPPNRGYVKFEGFFLPRRLRRCKEPMRLTFCGAGLHWYWPATTSIDHYPIAFQTDNLPSQSFETEDGFSITVGGSVSYTIPDLVKLFSSSYGPEKTIAVHTLTAIHRVCCSMKLEKLKEEQRRGTLNTKLRLAAQKSLTAFGVQVEQCSLTDLTKSRAIRLIQSTQQDD